MTSNKGTISKENKEKLYANNQKKGESDHDTTRRMLMIATDLYCLRFVFGGDWYRLTDYIRKNLIRDGFNISYTKDDVIVNGYSIKQTADLIKKNGK